MSVLAIVQPDSTYDQVEGAAGMGIGELAQRYLNERVRRVTLRPGSVPAVRYTLGTLVEAVGWDLPPNRLRLAQVEKWMERKYRGRPLADSTKRTQLSTVRTFCTWMVRKGYTRTNVALLVECPRQPRRVPRGVGKDAVGRTHNACPDARAELIVSLEVQQLLRACEVSNLQLGDIIDDPDEPAMRAMLITGKGGHERVVPITGKTWLALTRYLAERPATAGPLIRSYNHPNRGISARYISRLVSDWMHAAGVNETGHALRHTGASDMARAGVNVLRIQRALGHVSLATTQRYMPYDIGELREAMEGRDYHIPTQLSLELIAGGRSVMGATKGPPSAGRGTATDKGASKILRPRG